MAHHKRDYVEEMHAKGYRVTPQRLAILDAVCDVGGHATIGEIQLRLKQTEPPVDLATIYRGLKILCDVGLLVSATTLDQGIVYEIASETPHHHLVCTMCGKTQGIESDVFHTLREAIVQSTGFVIHVDHFVLKGVCQVCQAQHE